VKHGKRLVWISLLLTLCLWFALQADAAEIWDGTVADSFAGGSGTADDPYQIENGAQLAKLGETRYNDRHFVQIADIYLNDTSEYETWSESVSPSNIWPLLYFDGEYDGAGYCIDGLYQKSVPEYAGLFSQVGPDGEIRNVHVTNAFIHGEDTVGGIVGSFSGDTIDSCSFSGKVIGTSGKAGGITAEWTGGMAGLWRKIRNCVNYGSISSVEDGAGGIVGSNVNKLGDIEGCTNYGNVTGLFASGIGYGYKIADCSNYGSVTAQGEADGIGYSIKTITNCHNYGDIKGRSASGITKAFPDKISNCTNNGAVTAKGKATGIGDVDFSIINCRNTGKITSTGGRAAGISLGADEVIDCCNEATVTGAEGAYGIGRGIKNIADCINQGNVTASNSYADVTGIGSGTTIKNCSNFGNIIGESSSSVACGIGIGDTIENCSNQGTVNSRGDAYGIAGIGSGTNVIQCRNDGNVEGYYGSAGIGCGDYFLDCTNNGAIIATSGRAAGIAVGTPQKITIENCVNLAPVESYDNAASGIIATGEVNGAIIVNCINNAPVSTHIGFGSATGIAAWYAKNCTITNCINNGEISGSRSASGITDDVIGNSVVNGCANTASITGENDKIGGIATTISGNSTIVNCFNAGSVFGSSSKDTKPSWVGGIVAVVEESLVKNCGNVGAVNVDGAAGCSGGIAGELSGGSIWNSYNAGAVTADVLLSTNENATGTCGALVGVFVAGELSDCYSETGVCQEIFSSVSDSEGTTNNIGFESTATQLFTDKLNERNVDCSDYVGWIRDDNYGGNPYLQLNGLAPCTEHTVVEVAGKEPSCAESGFSASTYCFFCNATLEKQTETPPLGHEWICKKENGMLLATCLRCEKKEAGNSVSVHENAVTVTLLDEKQPTWVYVAIYDDMGRFVEVQIREVVSDTTTLTFENEIEGDVKAFFLGENMIPWLNALTF